MELRCEFQGVFRFEFAVDCEMRVLLDVQNELAEVMRYEVSRYCLQKIKILLDVFSDFLKFSTSFF